MISLQGIGKGYLLGGQPLQILKDVCLDIFPGESCAIVGASGSGKSTALNVLEDNGFYCIDNLPASLLPDLAQRALLHTELLQPQVAVSIDARNLPSQLQRFPELLQEDRKSAV